MTRERSLGVTESGFPGASFLEPTTDETPSWLARLREKNELLHAALSRLSDDHRRVIILRNLELHSFVDIARLMNRTPDAIRKLWMRALTALEQEMGGLDVP